MENERIDGEIEIEDVTSVEYAAGVEQQQELVTVTEGDVMASTKKKALKKPAKKTAVKPKAPKVAKAKKELKARKPKVKADGIKKVRPSRSGEARVTAASVFAFVKQVDGLPRRAQAILNAIEKIETGTAEQVAKRVVKSDYDGKQELVYLSGFFLRKFVKLGAVTVQE